MTTDPSATSGRAARLVDQLALSVPDFPKPGIMFRDLSPVFADGAALRAVTDEIAAPFAGRVDAVAGVEARGFVLAAAAAYALGVGMLIVRKPGKLPRPVIREDYALEYGTATLEVHPDELAPASRVLLLDDVLATGGTLTAATKLIERAGWTVAGISVVLELQELGGRSALEGRDIHSLVTI